MSPSMELDPASEPSDCLVCKTTLIGTNKTRYCSEKSQQKAQQKARKERKAAWKPFRIDAQVQMNLLTFRRHQLGATSASGYLVP